MSWKRAEREVAPPGDVVEAFFSQAGLTPRRLALSTESVQLDYEELARRASSLAEHLIAIGVTPEAPVAVLAARSAEALVAALAVLAAGGVYVPIDAAYPLERQRYLLADSGAEVLVGSWEARGSLGGAARFVAFDEPAPAVAAGERRPWRAAIQPHGLAYIIYTSGSTGAPKGVMVEHGALWNLIKDHVSTFEVVPDDRLLLVTSPSFDASMFQLFTAWATGASVLAPPERVITDPDALVGWINAQGASLLSMPPAYLHALGRRAMPSLRLVNTGGDAPIVEDALHYARHCRYFSTYGPTEATICSAAYEVRADEAFPDGVPLGRPVRNAAMFVVDPAGRVCTPGEVGEIWITGAGLARGYHARPALTADKFVAHPLRAGERAYRTGDLGCQRPDGLISFRGRLDRQVKIRGFRVEPEEVELRLAALDGVERAVVFPRGEDASTRKLVACVVGRPGLDPVELRRRLSRDTPAHLLPSRIAVLDALPLTANGKIDLARLEALEALEAQRPSVAEQPLTAGERPLLELLQEILGRPVSAEHGFFELGGDSLSAARLISTARARLGYELCARDLLRGASVRELARELRAPSDPAALSLTRLADASWYPASDAQRRLWLAEQVNEGSRAYNLIHAWQIEGNLQPGLLRRALQQIVRRHEALRTRFQAQGASLMQQIEPNARFDWHEPIGAASAEAFLEREAGHVFSLSEGPLVRAALLRVGPQRWLFSLNIHHIVCDGWSLGVITRELERAYASLLRGQAPPDAPLALQARDFVAWQRRRLDGPAGRTAKEFWLSKLGEGAAEPLRLPADRPRRGRPSRRGGMHTFRIPSAQAAALEQLARAGRTTLFAALSSVVAALLYRETHQRDICLGAPFAERDHLQLHDQVGFYVNTLVLRAAVDGKASFIQLLEQYRDVCAAAQQHGFVPFDWLVENLSSRRDPSRSPLFDVMIALQEEKHRTLRLADTACSRFDVRHGTSKFDLSFDFVRTEGDLVVELEYATDSFDADRIERLARRQLQLLGEIIRQPHARLDDLQRLPPAELVLLHAALRGRPFAPPPAESLTMEFHRVAVEDPRRPALISRSLRLDYGRLAALSRRLGDAIAARLGPAPSRQGPIAVMLDRSAEFFAVVLALLDRGQAYLPLDAGLPPERLRDLLERAACPLLVTRGCLLPAEWNSGVETLDLDASAHAPSPTTCPAPAPRSDSLAYCIYTSGSTGEPKAVGVTRANLRNAVEMWRRDYALVRPVVLQLASFAFDVSVGDLGRSLLSGGTLIVASDEERVDPAAILRLIEQHGVTFLETTPLVANALRAHLDVCGTAMPPLSLLVVGSDAWKMGDLRAMRRCLHPATRLLNSYGTTETTIDSSFFEYDPSAALRWSDDAPAPLGRPMSNVEFLIVDPFGRELGIGNPGELCIAGPSVSLGYLGRSELTAARFIPHPSRPGELMYRTGDIGVVGVDGEIVLVGRADHQVKIRGYRVELGEIEQALHQHPSVRDAVALVRGEGGEAALIGCVVGPTTSELVELEALLGARLPHYMVPTRWLLLDTLPASANAKVDRPALLALAADATPAPRPPMTASTPLEELLLESWREVLPRAGEIGITDSFFSLGGDSIQVIALVLALRRRGVELSAAELFRHLTIQACAAHLASRPAPRARRLDPALAGVPSETRERLIRSGDLDLYPATAMQSLMLEATARHGAADGVYLGHSVWELEADPLDIGALREALLRQVARNGALRTAFCRDDDGRWYQRERPVSATPLEEIDLSGSPRAAQDEALAGILARSLDARHVISGAGPACRIVLLRRALHSCALALATHHAVDDGWGLMAFERALVSDYAALRRGTPLEPAKPWSTGQQLVMLEAERLNDERSRAYWQGVLERLPAPPRYRCDPGPAHGARFQSLSLDVRSAEAVARLGLEGTALKAAYLGALIRALAADAGTEHASAWVVMNGRSERLEAALDAVGLFWNLVPIAGSAAATTRELEARLHEAQERGPWFFPSLFGDCSNAGFPVCFNFVRFHQRPARAEGIRVLARRMSNVWHFPLTVSVALEGGYSHGALHAVHDTWALPRSRAMAILERTASGVGDERWHR